MSLIITDGLRDNEQDDYKIILIGTTKAWPVCIFYMDIHLIIKTESDIDLGLGSGPPLWVSIGETRKKYPATAR